MAKRRRRKKKNPARFVIINRFILFSGSELINATTPRAIFNLGENNFSDMYGKMNGSSLWQLQQNNGVLIYCYRSIFCLRSLLPEMNLAAGFLMDNWPMEDKIPVKKKIVGRAKKKKPREDEKERNYKHQKR